MPASEDPADSRPEGDAVAQHAASRSAADRTRSKHTSTVGNLLRGALIGLAETVPGVSGGTVALVVGIYEQLIGSAASAISGARRLITGPDRVAGARRELHEVQWRIIVPVLLGMVVTVFAVAGPMAGLVENYPVAMRALFFGMVAASVAVPVRMVLGELRGRHVAAGVLAAVVAFLLVSVPPTEVGPAWWVLLPAAAIAVSALVLPGLSGSFLLLTFGLYQPTLRAVDERDLAYLGVFALGLLVGLIVIVKILRWLLLQLRTLTLSVLAGVMVGGLRALWPWQDGARVLAAPGGDAGSVAALGLLGFAVVAVLVWVDARADRRAADPA